MTGPMVAKNLRGCDDAREDIAAELVGAEWVRPCGRLQKGCEIESKGIVGSHQLRHRGAKQNDGQDQEPNEGGDRWTPEAP